MLANYTKTITIILYLAHALLILAAYFSSVLIRYDGHIPGSLIPSLVSGLCLLMALKIMLFKYFGLYRNLWKYASISDLVSIIKANTVSNLIFVPFAYFIFGLPLCLVLIDWMLSIIIIGGSRMGYRLSKTTHRLWPVRKIFRIKSPNTKLVKSLSLQQASECRKKILIFGAGDAGEMLCRQIREIPRLNCKYEVVGFIDDDPHKIGRSVHGITILGDRESIRDIYSQYKVDEVITAIPSFNGHEIRKLLDHCSTLGIMIRTIPGLEELMNAKGKLLSFRKFDIEDILRREPVKFNEQAISRFLAGKRILVTGAGGSIGSELCRQIIRFEPESLLMLGRGENSIFKTFNELMHINPDISIKEVIGDVINKKKLQGVFRSFMPQIVFHAGADKHVPLMELNPDEAVFNNVLGTKNILEVAGEYNAEKVVCISTDKAVNPTSVMGCCKRICEFLVQSNANGIARPVAVRFGNVLGSRGSVIKLFQQQIAWGGPVAVTHPEATRFFMSIPEAAQLVIEAGAMGKGGEIFVLDMGEQIKIVDLAKDLIQLAGYTPGVDIPLKFIGLRPGEKLKEELAAKDELLEETPNKKIWSISPNGKAPANLSQEIDGLVESSLKMDFPSIVEKLKVVVPEYKPQNKYELQHN